MPGRLSTYGFINAKLRTRLSGLLTEEFLQLVVGVGSLVEAVAMFRNTPFAFVEAVYSSSGDLKMVEDAYRDFEEISRILDEARDLVYNMLRFSKPIVSAINLAFIFSTPNLLGGPVFSDSVAFHRVPSFRVLSNPIL